MHPHIPLPFPVCVVLWIRVEEHQVREQEVVDIAAPLKTKTGSAAPMQYPMRTISTKYSLP